MLYRVLRVFLTPPFSFVSSAEEAESPAVQTGNAEQSQMLCDDSQMQCDVWELVIPHVLVLGCCKVPPPQGCYLRGLTGEVMTMHFDR